eukprot:CAMPEP_0184300444 /NCGR_PEP_ID=MMETSP1049-20130417/10853_1 /TAXON_ID=77928 /ORGANISM="Proteomonas sulcata, Strain CCMP704" /LENGTH=92 /DNA_ID=CAMNT_0026611161 /DNA_START=186 /DNA_END=464 /DNA_ORIENTATION=+
MAQVYNSMDVVYLDEKQTEIKSVDQGLAPSQRGEGSWGERLRTSMVTAASTPKVPVRAVTPRAGVSSNAAGEELDAFTVKKMFSESYVKAAK